LRIIRLLVPLALLCLAAPAFAICGYCDNNTCTWSPGLYQRCYYEHLICGSVCHEASAPHCDGPGFAAQSFSDEYRIVSVAVEDANATPIKQKSAALPSKTVVLKKRT
jgi:hypothetical protein